MLSLVCAIIIQFYVSILMKLQATLKGKNRITDLCFDDCVHDFTTRKVLGTEVEYIAAVQY